IDFAVQARLDAGELVRVLQPWCNPFAGFYIYLPSRAQMPAKERAWIDFLVEKRECMTARTSSPPRSKSKPWAVHALLSIYNEYYCINWQSWISSGFAANLQAL
ncbi:hypothetical protein ABN217_19640, partial [Proteus sp. fly-1067]